MKKSISFVMAGFVAVAMGATAFATDVNVNAGAVKAQLGNNGNGNGNGYGNIKVLKNKDNKQDKQKKEKANNKVKLNENDAKVALEAKLEALKERAVEYTPIKTAYDQAKAALKAYVATKVDTATGNSTLDKKDPDYVTLKDAFKAANKKLIAAKKAYNKAKTAYNKAYAKFKAAGGTADKETVKLVKTNNGVVVTTPGATTDGTPVTQPAGTAIPVL